MANVCDYVKWRGDLNLKKDVFNEIDGLILSRLSYFPLEQLLEENEEITIEEFAKRFEQTDKTTLRILWEDDKEQFTACRVNQDPYTQKEYPIETVTVDYDQIQFMHCLDTVATALDVAKKKSLSGDKLKLLEKFLSESAYNRF